MTPTGLTSPRSGPRDRAGKVGKWLRERGPGTLVELAVNFGLPVLIYSLSKSSLGDVGALMASSAAPMGWSILRFVRRRRIDALSLLALASIALSLLGFLGGGGVRLLQLREHLVAAAFGLVFLGSAAIGKPLIYQLSRARLKRNPSTDLESFEALSDSPRFRRAMMTMTVVWGVGLLAESALACALIFVMSIPKFMLVSRVIGYSIFGGLVAWTFWYARRRALAAITAGESRAPPPAAGVGG